MSKYTKRNIGDSSLCLCPFLDMSFVCLVNRAGDPRGDLVTSTDEYVGSTSLQQTQREEGDVSQFPAQGIPWNWYATKYGIFI